MLGPWERSSVPESGFAALAKHSVAIWFFFGWWLAAGIRVDVGDGNQLWSPNDGLAHQKEAICLNRSWFRFSSWTRNWRWSDLLHVATALAMLLSTGSKQLKLDGCLPLLVFKVGEVEQITCYSQLPVSSLRVSYSAALTSIVGWRGH